MADVRSVNKPLKKATQSDNEVPFQFRLPPILPSLFPDLGLGQRIDDKYAANTRGQMELLNHCQPTVYCMFRHVCDELRANFPDAAPPQAPAKRGRDRLIDLRWEFRAQPGIITVAIGHLGSPREERFRISQYAMAAHVAW